MMCLTTLLLHSDEVVKDTESKVTLTYTKGSCMSSLVYRICSFADTAEPRGAIGRVYLLLCQVLAGSPR
jgi:hypothetical protein